MFFAVATMATGVTAAMAGSANAATSTNLGCAVVGAHAKPPRPDAGAIQAYTTKMAQEGASHTTIDAGLKACFGLTPLAGTPVAQVRPYDSQARYITMPSPSVYWSSTYNDNVVTGNWNWWSYDGFSFQDHSDGFALGASNPIRILSQSAGWYGDNFGTKTSTTSDGGGNLGRGFAFNNGAVLPIYNDSYAKYGWETLVFDRSGYGCGNVYFTPHYSHGWSSSGLTGITITLSGGFPVVTASYTNTSNQWQGYGADSNSYNIC